MNAAAAVVLVVGLAWGRDFFAPILMAAVIVVIAFPVRALVRRKTGSRWVATAALMAVAYAILLGIAALIFAAAAQFVRLLPQFSAALDSASVAVVEFSRAMGLTRRGAESAGDWLQPEVMLAAAESLVAYLVSQATALALVVVYIFFLSVDSARFNDIRAHFAEVRRSQLDTLVGLTAAVRRYFAVSSVFGAIVATLDTVLLLILNVPGALVWGILAFVTNFIPNIGFVLGLIPAVTFAFLSGGWVTALIVFTTYCLINVVLQTFIQPRFVGEAVRLSQTLAFGSVIFWTIVIGPPGAILAVPLTLTARASLIRRGSRSAEWWSWITGDRRDTAR
ncbi:AI-2E family transporter [Conyzicola sp.]|uniref:AI-2E family transporter n=1 Tax=Conyzicola sp. TaxID=1969404 RepID=UPI003988D9DB